MKPRPQRSAVNMKHLRQSSVRSGVVTMSAQVLIAGIQLVSTVVLARLLSPSDYGVFAMVVAITAFAAIFRDLGLSSAAIQAPSLNHAQQNALFWINVAAGLSLSLIVAALAPAIAWFYETPEVRDLTLLLSLTFVITSTGTQHGALMQRNLQFGRRSIGSIAGAVVTATVAIVLGIQDYGYWALAWGTVAGATTTAMLRWALSPFRPGAPARQMELGSFLRFGSNVTAFDLVNYFHRNLDNILIGRMAGAGALGLYSRAYQLLMLPITVIRDPIMAVAYPAMSRLADQPDGLRTYYMRTASLLAFVSMPLSAYMGVTAAPLIAVALGNQWDAAAPLFAILAIAGFVQTVAGLRGLVLLSTGRSSPYLHWGIANAACMAIGFLVGIQWGALGVAIAYSVVTYVLLLPSLAFAFKGTSIGLRDFFRSIARPAISSMLAASLTFATRPTWSPLEPLPALAIATAVFTAAYLAVFLLTPGGRREFQYKLALARSLLSRPAESPYRPMAGDA